VTFRGAPTTSSRTRQTCCGGPLVWLFLRDNIKLAALLYYNDEIDRSSSQLTPGDLRGYPSGTPDIEDERHLYLHFAWNRDPPVRDGVPALPRDQRRAVLLPLLMLWLKK
jgi:hypothetical protein